jgi:hypothetical protein
MNVFDWLRKGFGYVLLTMGVSRPAPKPADPSVEKPAAEKSSAEKPVPTRKSNPPQR